MSNPSYYRLDEGGGAVTAEHPLPVALYSGGTASGTNASPVATTPATLAAAPWTTGSTAQDVRSYPEAEIQVSGLSGGDTIAVTRSIDGTNYAAVTGVGQDLSIAVTISADGIFAYPGGGYLKYAKTGSASTPTVTLRAGG